MRKTEVRRENMDASQNTIVWRVSSLQLASPWLSLCGQSNLSAMIARRLGQKGFCDDFGEHRSGSDKRKCEGTWWLGKG